MCAFLYNCVLYILHIENQTLLLLLHYYCYYIVNVITTPKGARGCVTIARVAE